QVQHSASFRQQRRALSPLDPSDLIVVGAHRKHRYSAEPSQFRDAVDLPVQHHPADVGFDRSASYLRHRGAAAWLHDDSRILAGLWRLDYFQQLLALCDWVAVGVDNLRFHSEILCRFLSRRSLLALIVVVFGY